MNLKYLFKAEFSDGSTFSQDESDRSALEPETRSQFYDVLNCGKTVTRFHLEDRGLLSTDRWTVDLTDGHFEHNGHRFSVGEPLPGPAPLRLIFYRMRQAQQISTIKDGETTGKSETDIILCYVIGWQCTILGKNYQQIVRVN